MKKTSMLSSLEVDGHVAGPAWMCALPRRKRMSGQRVLQGVSGLMRTVNISSDPWGITHDRDWHDLTPW